MDTKWKKTKIVVSTLAFILGMSLVLGGVTMVAGTLLTRVGTGIGWGGDYQQSANFRDYISGQLAGFLDVASGGTEWKRYGDDDYFYYGWEWYDNVAMVDSAEDSAEDSTEDADLPSDTKTQSQADAAQLAAYMASKAENQNVRYAVLKGTKVIYSNIDGLERRYKAQWKDGDWEEMVSGDEYNFFLQFNRKGDGKVEITKDGAAVDIYGDGVYHEDSLWSVPGYTNFPAAASISDVMVFMAVTKEPKLYVATDHMEGGSREYGATLYYLYRDVQSRQKELQAGCIALLVGIGLLVLAWRQRDAKGQGVRAIGHALQNIWVEVKILLGALVLWAVCYRVVWSQLEGLREVFYLLFYEHGAYLGNLGYYLGGLAESGAAVVAVFWLIYLIRLDVKWNRGRQKRLFLGMTRTRGLKYVMQQNLVKRYRVQLIASVAALALGGMTLVAIQRDAWNEGGGRPALAICMAAVMAVLLVCVVMGFGNVKKNRQFAVDVGALVDQIVAIREGNLTQRLELPQEGELKTAAEHLNAIQSGLEAALQEQMKSERMKVDLVTNVSHDLKTPLTSIISYVDLLKQEEELPSHVREFITILGEKAERLKTIVQDVFEVSKAAAGQLPVDMEVLDLGKLLRQTLADMNEQITDSGRVLKCSVPDGPVLIQADGRRLYRVFQNLIQNALKYSMEGTRIFLTLKEESSLPTPEGERSFLPPKGESRFSPLEGERRFSPLEGERSRSGPTDGAACGRESTATVYIKNTSAMELVEGMDFTERFVRGDASRTDGGSGLGLSIAKSFTEACGGQFHTEVDADLFTAVVRFPLALSAERAEATAPDGGK